MSFDPKHPGGHEFHSSLGVVTPARILCADRRVGKGGTCPIVALIEQAESEYVVYVDEKGHLLGGGRIVNKPVVVTRERWLNVYKGNGAEMFESEANARGWAGNNLLKTIHITWEETQ